MTATMVMRTRAARDEGGSDHGGGPAPAGRRSRARRRRPARAPRTLIIVNAESLRRGTTEGDELCEIEGIGPVSVAAATELLSEGGFQYLVKEGFDIKTVTKSTRVIANCIDMALSSVTVSAPDRAVATPSASNATIAGSTTQRRPDRARQSRPALSVVS